MYLLTLWPITWIPLFSYIPGCYWLFYLFFTSLLSTNELFQQIYCIFEHSKCLCVLFFFHNLCRAIFLQSVLRACVLYLFKDIYFTPSGFPRHFATNFYDTFFPPEPARDFSSASEDFFSSSRSDLLHPVKSGSACWPGDDDLFQLEHRRSRRSF